MSLVAWVILALIASLGLNVLTSVLIFRTSQRGMQLLHESHERTNRYTEGLLNRVMARSYGEFQSYELAPDGETEDPTLPPEPVVVLGPDRGGFGSRLGLRGWAEQDEDKEEEIQRTEAEMRADVP